MAKIAWDGAATAEHNARGHLPEMLAEYFAAGRELAARDPSAGELHAFRLATKRVRYTLEMFRPVYGRGVEPYIESLRKVQTLLGDVNDCAATRARLDAVLDAGSEERSRVDRFLDERQAALTNDFLKFWREEFDAGGNEARWRAYLRGTAAKTKTAPAAKEAAKKAATKKAVKKAATARRRAPARRS